MKIILSLQQNQFCLFSDPGLVHDFMMRMGDKKFILIPLATMVILPNFKPFDTII